MTEFVPKRIKDNTYLDRKLGRRGRKRPAYGTGAKFRNREFNRKLY